MQDQDPPVGYTTPAKPVETGHSVLLYDGVCGLCNGLVQFVLPRDRHRHFYFAPLQSDYARMLLLRYGKNADDLNTFYVVAASNTPAEHLLFKSNAALYVLSQLGFPCVLTATAKVVPQGLRDKIYDFIAGNRYKWFGKRDMCLAPTPQDRERFLG